jgi:uncharacterized protein
MTGSATVAGVLPRLDGREEGYPVPFTAVFKPAGAACNLDCDYCFFLSKGPLRDVAGQQMDEGALRECLRNLFRSSPPGPVAVQWQGGEPTMRGLDFFRTAVSIAKEECGPAQTPVHSIQTNATLLDDEWCAFLAQNDFLVGVSIDGPARMHDAYRVNRGRRGTHSQVVRGWRLLQAHGIEATILCTVHAANQAHGGEVYRYFRDELGARHIQFIPIVERFPAGLREIAENHWVGSDGDRVPYRQAGSQVTSRTVDPEALGGFLCEAFDEWAAHDIGSVSVQHFDAALGNLMGRPSLCVHAPSCGDAIAVLHNGDVYSCDHFVEPGYLLGNAREASLSSMVRSPRQREFGAKNAALPQQCRRCPVLATCQGGCPKDRFARSVDGEPGLNFLCPGYLRFFTHIEPALREMLRMLASGRDPRAFSPGHPAAGRR